MVVLREQLEHAVVIRLVADLQRIHEHEATAGLQHAREFAKDDAAHLGGNSWNMKMLVTASWLASAAEWPRHWRQGVDPAPAFQMSLRLRDVRLRHVDPERRKARPGLLEEIEKAAGAAADVEKSETALIAPGKSLVQWRQRLPSRGIGGAVEQHLHLGIVAPG